MVDEADHQQLRERLVVRKGPLDFDLGKTERCFLADLAESLRVTDIVIDSLKTSRVDLIKADVGGRLSFQIGETIARGIEVCVLHHQRKAQQGGSEPKAPANAYGSRRLTAGMGAVLMLFG